MRTIYDIAVDLCRPAPLLRLPEPQPLTWRAIQGPAWWREFGRWPPNVFALTSVLLRDSGAYRYVVSPPIAQSTGLPQQFPLYPSKFARENLRALRRKWVAWWARPDEGMPTFLEEAGRVVLGLMETSRDAREVLSARAPLDSGWKDYNELVFLHAVADTACAIVGIPGPRPKKAAVSAAGLNGDELVSAGSDEHVHIHSQYLLEANSRLVENSNISDTAVRVLPKLRTPQTGITIRSLSLHACIDDGEFDVRWHAAAGLLTDNEKLSLLLVPYPFKAKSEHFRQSASSFGAANVNYDAFGFFEFAPDDDKCAVDDIVSVIEQEAGVDGVVLPECALTAEQYAEVRARLPASTRFFMSGIRGPGQNYAALSVRLSSSGSGNDDWREWRQAKHHRWRLTGDQLKHYKINALAAGKSWWEAIRLDNRELHFICAGGWLTMCYLICEDLARLHPVADLVRAVGPTLLIALLLDGEQLGWRWASRFARVLAEDPGCSVLTVSSLGMCALNGADQGIPNPQKEYAIASWTSAMGSQEIKIRGDARSTRLDLRGTYVREYSADGRDDGGHAGAVVLGDAGSGAQPSSGPAGFLSAAPAQGVHEQDATLRLFFATALLRSPRAWSALCRRVPSRLVVDEAAIGRAAEACFSADALQQLEKVDALLAKALRLVAG